MKLEMVTEASGITRYVATSEDFPITASGPTPETATTSLRGALAAYMPKEPIPKSLRRRYKSLKRYLRSPTFKSALMERDELEEIVALLRPHLER